MRRTAQAGLLSLALATGLGLATTAPTVSAAPAEGGPAAAPAGDQAQADHDLPNPLEDKRRALREEAITQVLNGEAEPVKRGKSTVVKVGTATTAPAVNARGKRTAKKTREAQYVELNREATDRVFGVLVEFGDERHPDYPDQDTDPATPGPQVFDGPLHNAIPEPDRSEDNSTVWQADYDREHYRDIYFGDGGKPGAGKDVESVREYYERQSSGRYSISGDVSDWVKVPYNEARYGRSNGYPCAGIVCSNTHQLILDAVNAWYADQQAKGLSKQEILDELATYDVWDRYDVDGDGDFNEPDGYIDHFQIVHSGGDQADGDPYQGEDAIWSHRWYTQTTPIGQGGPEGAPLGGSEIGDSGIWVGDYTIQPENGGVSVFTHEYGHDLGLPDLYDTGGGENGVNWWSMMAQSRVSGPDDEGLGTRGADLGAYEKLQLGWLDYEVALPEQKRRIKLGPHEYNNKNAQAVAVVLPKKEVTTQLAAPPEGQRSWWSGTGDDYTATMGRQVELPAEPATLDFQANVNIEDCGPDPCDYAYVEVDDGSGWKAIPGSVTKAGEGNAIDGDSGGWVPATFDLSAYAGQSVGLRVRYRTDGAVQGQDPDKAAGIFVDDISVTAGGAEILADGAEDGPNGWELDGFSSVGASVTNDYDNYYLASHRDYVSFDKYLETGPYNFGFAPERPDYVEHFPYQDGLLVSYWDTSQSDNATSQHPGEGLILPVDANPRPIARLDGGLWRARVAGYDATFSKEKSDSFTLHHEGNPSYIRGQKAQPVFNDGRKYWYASQPGAGVKVPDNGVNIRVQKVKGTSMTVKVYERR